MVFEIAMFLGISPDMTILGLVDIGVMSTSSSVASVPKKKAPKPKPSLSAAKRKAKDVPP